MTDKEEELRDVLKIVVISSSLGNLFQFYTESPKITGPLFARTLYPPSDSHMERISVMRDGTEIASGLIAPGPHGGRMIFHVPRVFGREECSADDFRVGDEIIFTASSTPTLMGKRFEASGWFAVNFWHALTSDLPFDCFEVYLPESEIVHSA